MTLALEKKGDNGRNMILHVILYGNTIVRKYKSISHILNLLWLKLQYIRQERNFDFQNVTLKNAQVCEGTPSKLGSVNSHPEKMTLPSPNNATHQSKTHHAMKV